MQRAWWLVGIVACVGLLPGIVGARDVQLRSQGDADATGTGFVAAPAATASSGGKQSSTEDRLVRLENIVDGQMLDIVMRLQAMEREIQVLRGEIEVHSHQLEEQAKKQRDLYVVLDQRLQSLEKQIQGLNSTSSVGAAAATAAGTTTTAKPEISANSATEDDHQTYQQALDYLYQQQFDKAISGFRTYIQKNPQGRYAHVSQYWIAEAYYALGQFKAAVSEYQKLIDTYPASPKLAEAMVKMGEGYTKLNDHNRAKKVFAQVVHNYPGTDEARQAEALLQKMKTLPKAAPVPAAKKKHN